MVNSNIDDFADENLELVHENIQLKGQLDALQKKNEAYDGELKTLHRKLIKLLEEKVNRLEMELSHFVRIDNVNEM